jgi:hypothetical protein
VSFIYAVFAQQQQQHSFDLDGGIERFLYGFGMKLVASFPHNVS